MQCAKCESEFDAEDRAPIKCNYFIGFEPGGCGSTYCCKCVVDEVNNSTDYTFKGNCFEKHALGFRGKIETKDLIKRTIEVESRLNLVTSTYNFLKKKD